MNVENIIFNVIHFNTYFLLKYLPRWITSTWSGEGFVSVVVRAID